MNWRHMQAFVWLRWRLMANQWRRAGTVNAILMMIIAWFAVASVIPVFVGCFFAGVYLIPKAEPVHLLLAWDGLVLAFLLFWSVGVITDLQRNDPLSLSKFLHLPVSVNGAFLINYLSSMFRLSLLIFGPLMLAFALALVVVQGVAQLAVLPLLAAFLLMVTALTYQFQGWLASLMSNPRRRRTVIVMTTMTFVLIFQLPNLMNLYAPWGGKQIQRSSSLSSELAQLKNALDSEEIDFEEYQARQAEFFEKHKAESQREDREIWAFVQKSGRIANMVLPVGWLPLGIMSAAEGRALPTILGLAGMTLIGTASLWRAYRTTLALYQGQGTSAAGRAPTLRETAVRNDGSGRGTWLEANLPGLSEPVSVIALGGFRSLLRSPEAKMCLLTPLIMSIVFGSLLMRTRDAIPEPARPLLAFGGMMFVLFGLLQIMGNQFGVDRDGFRVFVLSSASRRDILLGKNIAHAPVALVLSILMVAILQILCPMRIDHALALVPQFLSMYLPFCILANLYSIYAPVYMAVGSLKPASPKMSTVLLQLALFLVLFPLGQGLTLLPLGAEAALNALGWARGWPVCLLLSLVESVAIVLLYFASLEWLGRQLQSREQRILETVTNRLP